MKKGFNQTLHPSLIPDQYDIVYNVGMQGTQFEPTFIEKWGNLAFAKRGVIDQPILSATKGVNENASAFLGLLNDLTFGGWNNGVPFIVDIWEAPTAVRYNLDNIRTHGIYITQNYKPVVKPLLRVTFSSWKEWYANNSTETLRLLNDFRILLCQPGIQYPSKLDGNITPVWWEYDWGMYANDVSGLFEGVVTPIVVPVIPPVEPPPVVEPEIPPATTFSFPKRWKVNLTITGTIEAEE